MIAAEAAVLHFVKAHCRTAHLCEEAVVLSLRFLFIHLRTDLIVDQIACDQGAYYNAGCQITQSFVHRCLLS